MIDTKKSTHKHPVLQLMYLLLFVCIGGIIFSVIGIAVYSLFSDDFTTLLQTQGSDMDINFIRTLQITSSIGIFIAGPLLFAKVENYKPLDYFHSYKPKDYQLLIIILGIMLLGLPILELINSLNQKMVLPDFLKGLELWMREKEEQASLLTKQLLEMKTYGQLFINLFMIAVIPAIGEELLFRGAMQNIFVKWFANPHVAIWLTAVVFSAIHVQFFGFFPRMLLGVLFGYFLLWGKSIWLPIWAHFVNNAAAVVMAFVFQQQGKSLDKIEQTTTFNTWGYLFSAIITLVLLVLYYQQSKTDKSEGIYG